MSDETDALKEAARAVAVESDVRGQERRLDPDAEVVVDPDGPFGSAEVEAVVDVEDPTDVEPWKPTNLIGDYVVMEKSFVNGLRYWVQEDGTRRVPTKNRPLRKYFPKPDPAQTIYLPLETYAVCCAALISEDGHGEDPTGRTVANRVNQRHVKLSFYDKDRVCRRFVIQLPDQLGVMGTELTNTSGG